MADMSYKNYTNSISDLENVNNDIINITMVFIGKFILESAKRGKSLVSFLINDINTIILFEDGYTINLGKQWNKKATDKTNLLTPFTASQLLLGKTTNSTPNERKAIAILKPQQSQPPLSNSASGGTVSTTSMFDGQIETERQAMKEYYQNKLDYRKSLYIDDDIIQSLKLVFKKKEQSSQYYYV